MEIDLESPYAGYHLLAVMHWPFDRLARKDFLVTAAAQIMQRNQDKISRRIDRAIRNVAARFAPQIGISVEDILARIETDVQDYTVAASGALNAEIDRQLFRPSGGFGRVAAAGGIDAIIKTPSAGSRFGLACGELLAYIVMLKTHHPNIPASLNRATHIMVECAKKEGRTKAIPPERSRKTMWKSWGAIAPLWAAAAFCEIAAMSRGEHTTYGDPEFCRSMVSTSLWLADFAVTFKPTGAKAPLLLKKKVIRLNCKLDAARPEIPPLPGERLALAASYRAPIPVD